MKRSYVNQIRQYSVADMRRIRRWNTAAKILDGIRQFWLMVLSSTLSADPEPQYLALCPRNTVIQRTINKIIDVQAYDVQTHLWREVHEDANFPIQDQDMNIFQFYYGEGFFYGWGRERGTFFALSVIDDTGTVFLREHAIRMDTDVQYILLWISQSVRREDFIVVPGLK
ncbi:hypothetical protein BJY01DRAFT_251104 [Aspergillus pseudoustus]|uniref:Uncharacterized protein n=1 Tax=Aspergillus pseudoustus TaxID=1810923 RepID=A0ABR4JDK2_9EURO